MDPAQRSSHVGRPPPCLMPFVSPATLRRTLARVEGMSDGALRFTGLSSMLLGLLILNLVR